MNPVWWGDPIARPAQVLHERNAILDIQVAIFGGYADLSDQLTGFARQVFIANPQYYEAPEWADYIADQIKDYEHSIWRGITLGGSTIGGLALALMTVSGVYGLWQDRQDDESSRWLIAIWSATIFLTTALLTPLEWQRYYLMTYPVVGLLASNGVVWLAKKINRQFGRAAFENPQIALP
jgi:amino acid transporter